MKKNRKKEGGYITGREKQKNCEQYGLVGLKRQTTCKKGQRVVGAITQKPGKVSVLVGRK